MRVKVSCFIVALSVVNAAVNAALFCKPEYPIATNGEARTAVQKACGFLPKEARVRKSAHNCPGKLYVCNGRCEKPNRFPGAETGICVI